MGVMDCYRPDCEEIMCRVYIDGIGYICYECESEFKGYIEHKYGDEQLTEGQIKHELKEFMKTSKGECLPEAIGEKMDVGDFFNQNRRD